MPNLDTICTIYRINSKTLNQIVEKFPPFAGLDHARVVKQASGVYGSANASRIKEAVLKFPPFVSYDHTRVVEQASEVYGAHNVSRIKEAVLKFPPFAGYDHARVVEQACEVYGKNNVSRIKEAVLKFPPFAGYDHARVYRQKRKIGEMIGLNREQIIDYLLKNPANAGYSYKRDLARTDVARAISKDGVEITKEIIDWFLKNYMTSPYSPGSRLRISRAAGLPEPKLLGIARKKFIKSTGSMPLSTPSH